MSGEERTTVNLDVRNCPLEAPREVAEKACVGGGDPLQELARVVDELFWYVVNRSSEISELLGRLEGKVDDVWHSRVALLKEVLFLVAKLLHGIVLEKVEP